MPIGTDIVHDRAYHGMQLYLSVLQSPPPCKSLPQKNVTFFYFFFYFRCILLQISHKKCFFL